MKRLRVISLLVVAMVLIGTLVYAAGGKEAMAKPGEKAAKDVFVVQLVKELMNPFFIEMKWGGQAAANKYGIKYECLAPEKYSVENQIRVMENLIQRKVDAIVLNPIDGKGIIPGIEQANKAGIPIINVDTKAEGGELLAFVTISNSLMGKSCAQHLVEYFNGQAEIVILEGTTGASSAQDRQAGIMEILKDNPGIKVLESITGRYDRQIGMKTMEDLLVRFPKIDAVLCANDNMALGALEAIKAAKRMGEILVYGMDAIPEALDSIKRGELFASIEGMAFEQAFSAVEIAALYWMEGKIPPKGTIFLEERPAVITKDNLVKWLGYREELFKKYGMEVPDELKMK